MKRKEYAVKCEWCGALPGAPCVNNINGNIIEVYKRDIHIARKRAYNKTLVMTR